MYAQLSTEARPASTQVKASIIPALDVSNVVHWFEPNGSTRTGYLQSLELLDGIWWGSALYQIIPSRWVFTHLHAFNFFPGLGPEFRLQLGQDVWLKRGNLWQAATVSDLYLESCEWFAVLEWREWYGPVRDERPLDEVRTTQPELAEDIEYSAWLDDRNDLAYEDWRDSR